MNELWKWVIGYRGTYKVSNFGNVRSVNRVTLRVGRKGGPMRWRGKRLKPQFNSNNRHWRVTLSLNGKVKAWEVGTLVLLAFVGPRPKGFLCCHKNDEPFDNKLDNLKWGTRATNFQDAVKNGKASIGTKRPDAKLNDASVLWLRSVFQRHHPQFGAAALSRKLKLSPRAVHSAATGKTWKHVRKEAFDEA